MTSFYDKEENNIQEYIQNIEEFLNSFDKKNPISTESVRGKKIEFIANIIKDFLVNQASALNYLEIFGTLDIHDRTIYVCCYEPYGDELFYIEDKNGLLYLIDKNSPIIDSSEILYIL